MLTDDERQNLERIRAKMKPLSKEEWEKRYNPIPPDILANALDTPIQVNVEQIRLVKKSRVKRISNNQESK